MEEAVMDEMVKGRRLGMPQMNVHCGLECVGCVGCAACTACGPVGFLIGYASCLTIQTAMN